jgi:hypothetical protein
MSVLCDCCLLSCWGLCEEADPSYKGVLSCVCVCVCLCVISYNNNHLHLQWVDNRVQIIKERKKRRKKDESSLSLDISLDIVISFRLNVSCFHAWQNQENFFSLATSISLLELTWPHIDWKSCVNFPHGRAELRAYLYIVPRIRKNGAVPLLPLYRVINNFCEPDDYNTESCK